MTDEAAPQDPLGNRRHLIITIERLLDDDGDECWRLLYDAKGISTYEVKGVLQQALMDYDDSGIEFEFDDED
jgi:hypothetical protein